MIELVTEEIEQARIATKRDNKVMEIEIAFFLIVALTVFRLDLSFMAREKGAQLLTVGGGSPFCSEPASEPFECFTDFIDLNSFLNV